MKARDISTVAVIGAGTMGAGIAGVFARAGCRVRMMDVNDTRLDHGLQLIDRAHRALVRARVVAQREARAALRRIQPTTSLETACKGVPLLVETAPEQLALKQDLFGQFSALCSKRAILASNTSGLSITDIASSVSRPQRVAGLHFWNPPHVVPLVEVTQGRRTSTSTAKTLLDVCRRLGKRPVHVRHDVPGFVGNRLQFAVLREALHLLNMGVASAEDIDTAMTAGPGLRWAFMGPLRTADLGGLDIFHAISSYLFSDLAAGRKPHGKLADLVRTNHLGAKTGRGFYRYTGKDLGEAVAQRDRVLLAFLKVLQRENRPSKGRRRRT